MGKGDSNVNFPTPPTYGEGMREALEAQVALLTGTKVGEDADFSQFPGGLQRLVEDFEAPLRKSTAQIDTDVLRQTLLGTERKVERVEDPDTGEVRYGIPGAEVVTDADLGTGTDKYELVELEPGGFVKTIAGDQVISPVYAIRDIATGENLETFGGKRSQSLKGEGSASLQEAKNAVIAQAQSELDKVQVSVPSEVATSASAGGGRYQVLMTDPGFRPGSKSGNGINPTYAIIDNVRGGISETFGGEEGVTLYQYREANKNALESITTKLAEYNNTIREADGDVEAVAREFEFTNPNIPADPSKAGQEGFDSEGRALLQEGQVVREGDGMIDLLGDRRNIMETRRLSRDERGLQLVEQNPELSALYEGAQNDPTNPFYGLTKQQAGRKLLDDNKGDLQKISEQFGIGNLTAPEFANVDTGRQAGFDEQGNFLGLSALAEDVQRANLSRQREADLADVERLSNRFQDVMADFRPGTTEALAGAREVLEAQRQRLVGQPASGQVDKSPLAVLNRGFREIEEDYQSTLDQYGQEAADAVRADAMNRLQASAATAGLTMDQVQAGPQAQPAQLTGFQDPTFTAETQLTGDAGLLGVLQSATQADVDAERATRVGETIQVDPLRARLIQDARSALGEGLTEREERQIAEAARARATMMGRTFDQSEAIAEAQARVAEDNQRRMQNRAFASQVLGQEAGLQSGDLGRGMQQELRQVGADMDAERLRQAQTAGFIDASTRLAGLEASTTMDPFAALLNRAGGGSLGQAGQVLGQAGYGLQSGPQFLNPESGLGFISQMAANEASMYGANVAADAAIKGGLYQGIGSAIGGLCWVAREVYGPLNPQWLQFREWMLSEAPNWFYHLYLKFGERFANWISDKPRIKAIIRKWMDSKIRG